MGAWSGRYLFVQRIMDQKWFEFVFKYFSMALAISKRLSWQHACNGYSAIKSCAYLRKEEAISGSTEMLHWKNFISVS